MAQWIGATEDARAAEAAVRTDLDFETLVRTHQRKVYSIAYHFLRDRGAAEEVAQDVFLELHKQMAAIESEEHALNWLRRVACHRSIDYARRLPKAQQVDWDSVPEPAQPIASQAANDPMGQQMFSAKLQELVASLPYKMRMAVILRYQEEAEPEEISKAMGMPVNTVKSHLHRALVMLRSKMGIGPEGKES